LLELEVAYLKNHHDQYHSRSKQDIVARKPSFKTEENMEEKTQSKEPHESPPSLQIMESNRSNALSRDVSLKIEALNKEKNRIQERISQMESHHDDEKNRFFQEISDLTGKIEMQRNDSTILEKGLKEIQEESNKLKIEQKDLSKSLEETSENLESKEEELKSLRNELNSTKTNLAMRDAQFHELEEKFLQSSVHMMEEAMGSLKNENSKLSRELKVKELEEDSKIQLRAKQEEQCTVLIAENAELAAKLAELKSKLESEVRLRDSRDSKCLLDSQEMAVLKEKERQLRDRVASLGDQLQREKERFKSVNDKLSKESQENTTLELRVTTLSHRISELEGSLSFANESTNKFRKQSLLDQDKINSLQNELLVSRKEVKTVFSQLAESEYLIKEMEDRVEALTNAQSTKWMEFSKMADSMKELSHSMLIQKPVDFRLLLYDIGIDELVDFICRPLSHRKEELIIVKVGQNPSLNKGSVDLIRLSDLVLNQVNKRNKSEDGVVLMKMDIEGIELEVLTDLLLIGALSTINLTFVEWHL
ncbi:unnamed protein product, partial [Lepeophtheirus salmonis]